jgi:hypothetical protein
LSSWVKALQDDKHEIFRAARDAHRAADLLLALEHCKSMEEALAYSNKSQFSHDCQQGVVESQIIPSTTQRENQSIEMEL